MPAVIRAGRGLGTVQGDWKSGLQSLSQGVQPTARRLQADQDDAMNAAQHKIVNLLKTFFFAHQFLLVFVYLMCGPGQLFFFQCGPETPKGWPPLIAQHVAGQAQGT